MQRPDRTKTQAGEVLNCPNCDRPVDVAIITGWYVFYCPICQVMHTHGQCRQERMILIVTSTEKGDQANGERKVARRCPGH